MPSDPRRERHQAAKAARVEARQVQPDNLPSGTFPIASLTSITIVNGLVTEIKRKGDPQ